jgi:hypothetical protein
MEALEGALETASRAVDAHDTTSVAAARAESGVTVKKRGR